MEYTYAAMLLHAAKQPINEENVKKILIAAGAKVDDLKVKALITALDGVNIDEAIAKAAVVAAPAASAAQGAGAAKEEKKVEEKSEEKKEEEAAAGLASLFG